MSDDHLRFAPQGSSGHRRGRGLGFAIARPYARLAPGRHQRSHLGDGRRRHRPARRRQAAHSGTGRSLRRCRRTRWRRRSTPASSTSWSTMPPVNIEKPIERPMMRIGTFISMSCSEPALHHKGGIAGLARAEVRRQYRLRARPARHPQQCRLCRGEARARGHDPRAGDRAGAANGSGSTRFAPARWIPS